MKKLLSVTPFSDNPPNPKRRSTTATALNYCSLCVAIPKKAADAAPGSGIRNQRPKIRVNNLAGRTDNRAGFNPALFEFARSRRELFSFAPSRDMLFRFLTAEMPCYYLFLNRINPHYLLDHERQSCPPPFARP
jgi:hypothetical protein